MTIKIKILFITAWWLGILACGGGLQTADKTDQDDAIDPPAQKPLKASPARPPAASSPASKNCPPEPGWVVGKEHPRFPGDQFLTGVGVSGVSAGQARDVALKNLAKNIKVSIHSHSRDFLSTEGVYAESAIRTKVDALLEGVERKDGYFDQCRGRYYSLVVMDRRLESEKHRQHLKETENRLKTYMTAAGQAENSGNLVQALDQYLAGYEESLLLDPEISALRVISKSAVPESPEMQRLSVKAFETKIRNLVQKVKLGIASGDGQKIQAMQIPRERLTMNIYLEDGVQRIPVKGLPVTFRFEQGTGTLQADSETDASGNATAGVRQIESYQENQHSVVARIDTRQINSQLNNKFSKRFLTPLEAKNAKFFYTIDKIQELATQSTAWQKGLAHLVEQVIMNINPEDNPVVGVIRFTDMRGNQMTAFSNILAEDFKNILAKSDNLKVREINIDPEKEINPGEIAAQNHLDMYVSGSFEMRKGGLAIIAKLINVENNTYLGSSDTLIKREALRKDDLAQLEVPRDMYTPASSRIPNDDRTQSDFRQELDKLMFAKPGHSPFNIKVWADRENYEIGDHVVFYVKAERDCYLTLINAGSSGNITIIFPNPFHKSNFIKAGKTYVIPGPDYGFNFDLLGPPGQERVKAIATLTPELPIDLDLKNGFHKMNSKNKAVFRDIGVMAENFNQDSQVVWAEAYEEIFIFPKNQTFIRGSRKIPLIEKPEKPIDMIGTFGNEEQR